MHFIIINIAVDYKLLYYFIINRSHFSPGMVTDTRPNSTGNRDSRVSRKFHHSMDIDNER